MSALAATDSPRGERHPRPSTPSPHGVRQMLEGMTLAFDPTVAGDLNATIQFNIGAPESITCFLRIADGDCSFHTGVAPSPSLTITTPADVWMRIASGELDARDGIMQGLYRANGDLRLMLAMSRLFKPSSEVSVEAGDDHRPAGPISLPGMSWMAVAFVPMTLFWIFFSIRGVGILGTVAIPLLLSLGLVCYRMVYDRPTWLEAGILLCFVSMAALAAVDGSVIARWGNALATLSMAGIWLSSLVLSEQPVSAEYSRWSFVRPLWRTSMFLHPNAVISLMWGWQFVASGALAVAAVLLPDLRLGLAVAQYALIVPAGMFTTRYQRGARDRRIADVDGSMARLRLLAAGGICVAVGMAAVALMWL